MFCYKTCVSEEKVPNYKFVKNGMPVKEDVNFLSLIFNYKRVSHVHCFVFLFFIARKLY